MRKFLLLILVTLVGVISADARRVPGDKVGVQIDTLIYDFGTIRANDPAVNHVFRMKVTGNESVSIIQAVPSCGCTTPDYPRRPTKPGETAEIKVVFNPAGQHGEQKKEVRLRLKNGANKAENISLILVGDVLPK